MSSHCLPAAEKIVVLLETLAAGGGALGLVELSRRSGLPKSTAHRLLQTLQKHLFVERCEGGYRLSVRLSELGDLVWARHPARLRILLQPWLQELFRLTGDVVRLNVLCGDHVVCAATLCGHESVVLALRLADRARAARTIEGKALLAYSADAGRDAALHHDLGRIRRRGVAMGRDTPDGGVYTVAAPVLSGADDAVAVMAVSSPLDRVDPGFVVSSVRAAARSASAALRLAPASGERAPGGPRRGA